MMTKKDPIQIEGKYQLSESVKPNLSYQKDAQGVFELKVMLVVDEVIRTNTEQVLTIGKEVVTISLELAKFLKRNTNHGFVLGLCVAALMSGYTPMSQGWWDCLDTERSRRERNLGI